MFPKNVQVPNCGGICIASKNNHTTAFDEMDTESKLLHFQLKMYGANLHENVTANTSYIVIPSHIQSEAFKSLGNFKKDTIQVVTEKWVADCIVKKRLLCEENYRNQRL